MKCKVERMNFDHEFTPLSLVDGKHVVADEDHYEEFLMNAHCDGSEKRKILVNAEALFSGHDNVFHYVDGEPITKRDLIQRLFQIIDNSTAEFYLWVGESQIPLDVFEGKEAIFPGMPGKLGQPIRCFKAKNNVHVGTSPEHANKLESIKHLVKDVFVMEMV